MARLTDDQRRALEVLAELGGGIFQAEDDIVQEGKRIIIPEGMTMRSAADYLYARIEADQEQTTFVRDFKFRPYDGAVCTWHALKRAFGMVGLHGSQGFFGPNPPAMIDVPVGPYESEQVPWGVFSIPILPNSTITPTHYTDEEMGELFRLVIEGPRKYRAQAEGLFALVQDELEQRSIYRGKAFDGQETPEFLDLSGVTPEKVIYSEETVLQLEANVWSVLRYRDKLKSQGISLKRSALFHGPYGTGKTLGGFLTAQIAIEHDWTFLYARPGRDDVNQVLQTARLYQPACVFFEDLDTVANPETASADGATRLLDRFDGITSKGTELMIVLTTNHPDRIHKGMLRPGRLDSVIEIGPLDEQATARLIQANSPEGVLAEDIDWGAVFIAAEKFLPAYVKEVADRAYRYALSRSEGETQGILLNTDDLVNAAHGLRPQLEMMEGAQEQTPKDALGAAFTETVKSATGQFLVESATSFAENYMDSEAYDKASKELNK